MTHRHRRKKSGCLSFVFWLLFFILAALIVFAVILTKEEIREALKTEIEHQFREEIPYEEVKIPEKTVEDKFYYDQLTQEEKIPYKEILQGVQNNEKQIYVHVSDANQTNRIFELVLKDHPGIFWCDGRGRSVQYEEEESYTILEPEYVYDLKEREQMQKEIDQEVQKCLDSIKTGASDYEKILCVFEYIVNSVDYDMNAPDNQNIYSVFVGKKSVCAGYSKATQYLLEKCGVFCAYITGETTGGESHAWNLVICDGDYYYVDTTWGDPVFIEKEVAVDKNYIGYDYMCCDDEQLQKTHIPDPEFKLPACTKMDENYYVVNGMYFEQYNRQEILRKMTETVSAKGNPSVFKFADASEYKKAKEELFSDLIKRAAQNIGELYGLAEVSYTYIDDKELNKIVIYWNYE